MGGWLSVLFILASGPSMSEQAGVKLTLAEDFFRHRAVREQLLSGLTTTLLIKCKPQGKAKHLAEEVIRIDIRFEPWDEVFFVDSWRRIGGVERETLDGIAGLERWWLTARHPLLERDHPGGRVGARWQVTMELLPFSQSDTERAKRWLAASRIAANEGINADADLADSQRGQGPDVVTVMLATSISRSVLLRRKWLVVVGDGR